MEIIVGALMLFAVLLWLVCLISITNQGEDITKWQTVMMIMFLSMSTTLIAIMAILATRL